MRQFEDIFDSIYDLDTAILSNFSNIPRTQPPILIKSLLSFFRIPKIPFKNRSSLKLDFPSRIRQISWSIAHFRHISESYLQSCVWPSDVPWIGVALERSSGASANFCLAVAFLDGAAEGNFKEVHYFFVYWSRTCDHNSHSSTQNIFHFVEEDNVIKRISVRGRSVKIANFRSYSLLEQFCRNTPLSFYFTFYLRVQSIQKPRNCNKDSRFSQCHIL